MDTDHAAAARELLARLRPGDDDPLTLMAAATTHALLDVAAAVREQTTAIKAMVSDG